jgi:cell division protein FtsI (penicillin-binding protein 3)
VAFASLAEKYYHDRPMQFFDHLHHLRLDTITGIDIVGAAAPLIKKPGSKYWTKTTLPFMAHGYEELVTPLHLLMVYNAVANNGKMMKPYLVNSIKEMGIEIKSFTPQVLVEKICSDETLGKLKDCLLAVIEREHGTGHLLKSKLYSFAGKTGTAVTAMDNRGYNKSAKIYQSAFIGYFPAGNPRYSIAVVIQNSNESRLAYGGVVAGPVFKEVADKIYAQKIGNESLDSLPGGTDSSSIYKFYGLKTDLDKILNMFKYPSTDSATAGSWRSTFLSGNRAELNPAYNIASTLNKVPDVSGMGLKDAVYLLENIGLKVAAKGRGKVIYQSLTQNADFHKGQSINLQLN